MIAHASHFIEPLLFAPAILAVLWAMVRARRDPRIPTLDKENQ